MQIFELGFPVRRELWQYDKVYTGRMLTLIDLFITELARNGLILEAGAHTSIQNGMPVTSVIAQDSGAITESNMSYDAKKALETIIKNCEGLPQIVPREECIDLPHCSCRHSSVYVMQPVPEWTGSPILCTDCRHSVPLYKIVRSSADREFDDLLHWRRLYRGYITEYKAGINAAVAYNQISDCTSDFSLLGRRFAGMIEASSGVMTLYPLYSENERKPDRCPQCGSYWNNQYRDAVPYECFCRSCRLVM